MSVTLTGSNDLVQENHDDDGQSTQQPIKLSKDGLLPSSPCLHPGAVETYAGAMDNYMNQMARVLDDMDRKVANAKRGGELTSIGLAKFEQKARDEAIERIDKVTANFEKFIDARAGGARKEMGSLDALPGPSSMPGHVWAAREQRHSEVRYVLASYRKRDNDPNARLVEQRLQVETGLDAGMLNAAEAAYLVAADEGDEETVRAVQHGTHLWRKDHVRQEVFEAGVRLFLAKTRPQAFAEASAANAALNYVRANATAANRRLRPGHASAA